MCKMSSYSLILLDNLEYLRGHLLWETRTPDQNQKKQLLQIILIILLIRQSLSLPIKINHHKTWPDHQEWTLVTQINSTIIKQFLHIKANNETVTIHLYDKNLPHMTTATLLQLSSAPNPSKTYIQLELSPQLTKQQAPQINIQDILTVSQTMSQHSTQENSSIGIELRQWELIMNHFKED